MTEEWRDVIGYEGLYQVSSLGQVRRVGGRVLKATTPGPGYRVVRLSRRGLATTHSVPFLVCSAFHGPRPSPHLLALHWNDVRTDDRAENLRWGTRADNVEDGRRNGRRYGRRPTGLT